MSKNDTLEDIPPFPDFREFEEEPHACLQRFQNEVYQLTNRESRFEATDVSNQQLSTSLLPKIPIGLLDLLGIRRAQYNSSLILELCKKVRQQLMTSDPKRVKEIVKLLRLEVLIRMPIPELRSVIFEALLRMEEIDEMYLRLLASEPEFLDSCPLRLRQMVWELEEHKSLFGDSVSPLLDEYVEAKDQLIYSNLTPLCNLAPGQLPQTFLSLSPDNRRGSKEIQKLIPLVGSSYKLYNTLCVFLRILFSKTRKPLFCTLRCDLVMSLAKFDSHGAIQLLEQEHCHQFISMLDQVQTDQKQWFQKLIEIHRQFRVVKKYMEDSYETLFDLIMALRDPYTVNMLARVATELATKLAKTRKLPRDSNEIVLTLHLLNIALQALSIIERRTLPEPSLDPTLISHFLPEIMALVGNDLNLCTTTSTPTTPISKPRFFTLFQTITKTYTPSDVMLKLLREDAVANMLFCHFLIHFVKKKQPHLLIQLLPVYVISPNIELLPEMFFHEFSTYLVPMLTRLSSGDMRELYEAIFTRFWSYFYHEEDAFRHACRLVRALCPSMPSHKLIEILEEMGRVKLSSEKMTEELEDTIHYVSQHSSVPLSFSTDGNEDSQHSSHASNLSTSSIVRNVVAHLNDSYDELSFLPPSNLEKDTGETIDNHIDDVIYNLDVTSNEI